MAEEKTPEKSIAPEKLSAGKKVLYLLGIIFFLFCGWVSAVSMVPRIGNWNDYTAIGLTAAVLIVFLAAALLLAYRIVVPLTKQNNIQNTLKPVVTVACIMVPFLLLVLPSFNSYKPRAYNSDAKSNLHNLYLGCKAYWAEQGAEQECDVSKVATQEYGYVQSTRVSIYGKGTETTFTATAQHLDSTTSYTMDSNGRIQ